MSLYGAKASVRSSTPLASDQGDVSTSVESRTRWPAVVDDGPLPGQSLLWWENGTAPLTGDPDLWDGGPQGIMLQRRSAPRIG